MTQRETLFRSLMRRQQGETVQDLFNPIYDGVFGFKSVTFETVEEFKRQLSNFSGDHVFNDFVASFLRADMSAYVFKSAIQVVKSFPNVSLESAFRVLEDVKEHTENEDIKHFVRWLTFDVADFIDYAADGFAELGLSDELFEQYIQTKALKSYLKHVPSTKKPAFSLLSFICQSDDENKAVIPALVKFGSIKVDWEKCGSLDEVFEQLLTNFNVLSQIDEKVKGFNVGGKFENAVRLFGYVAPNWDNLSATFNLRTQPIPTLLTASLTGGAHIADSDIVKIYGGDYAQVPDSEPEDKKVNIDVIADFNKFNQFSMHRKLQISHFLVANRKRFNSVLSEATQLIVNGLHSKLEPAALSSALRDRQFVGVSARSVGYDDTENAEASMMDEAQTFAAKLRKQFTNASPRTFDEGISFIVHSYLPLLNQFRHRCVDKYGMSTAQGMMSKFATDRTLNVIGVANEVDTSSNDVDGLSGGRRKPYRAAEEPAPQPQPEPIIREVVREVHIQDGGAAGASRELLDALIAGQKDFNKAYEDAYRKLVAALAAVSITNVQAQGLNKLYSVINQFDNIAIKRAKTTVYLSGYYGARNYNKLYTKSVEAVISALESAGVGGFENVISVLKQLKSILEESAKKVQALRVKYINASKSSSELFIIGAKKIKIPCLLGEKDFAAFDTAINRLFAMARNYSSETPAFNAKQQLENYISRLNNREEAIKEHYETLIQGVASRFNIEFSSTHERDYAKEACLSIIRQKQDIMLYFNKVFDAKLTKERIEKLNELTLSKEQLSRIESAYLAFKNVKITPEFHKLMKKIDEKLALMTLGGLFKLIKNLRKLVIKSNYLQFLSRIYKELNLFENDFNWQEFIDKYTNLIVISSIRIEPLYTVNNERYTPYGAAHHFAELCEKEARKPVGGNDINAQNAAYCIIMEQLQKALENYKYKKIPNTVNFYELLGGFTPNVGAGGADNNASAYNAGLVGSNVHVVRGGAGANNVAAPCDAFDNDHAFSDVDCTFLNADHFSKLDKDIYKFRAPVTVKHAVARGQNAAVGEGLADVIDNNLVPRSLFMADNVGAFGVGITDQNGSYALMSALGCVTRNVFTAANTLREQKKEIPSAYYWVLPVIESIMREANNAASGLNAFATSKFTFVNTWSARICEGDEELKIAESAVESLFANVVAIVDKYWSSKYRGILSLPTNINLIMRGGAKQEGGSVFDSVNLHDQTNGIISPEAVPFYICGIHVCYHYMTTFNESVNARDGYKLVMNVNKISTIYPIYEIFRKYNATVESLTPQQLKICIAVLNDIWNQTQGSSAARLSRSIDMLFTELNACFIFTDELQLQIIKSTNSLTKTVIDTISPNLMKIIDELNKVMEQTLDPLSMNPAQGAKRLELVLSRAFNYVKDSPESQRLFQLKKWLVDKDENGDLREFYAFMELTISPLLVCAQAYSHIFSLFDVWRMQNNGQAGTWSIDFGEAKIAYNPVDPSSTAADCVGFKLINNNAADGIKLSVWDVINGVRNGTHPEYKILLMESPYVYNYNKHALQQALDDMHGTGKFVLPKFWIVMDGLTYPTTQKVSFKYRNEKIVSDSIETLRQLYPSVNASNLSDYYNHVITEFAADYDHFIHAFLSYPGLSDKTIKYIADRAHDVFRVKFDEDDKENARRVLLFNSQSGSYVDQLRDDAKLFTNVKVTKSRVYIYPPPPPNNLTIPRFTEGQETEELQIVSNPILGDNAAVNVSAKIDGTGLYIESNGVAKEFIDSCDYSWLDWTLLTIARCDRMNNMIPYKLLQSFLDFPSLTELLRSPGYDTRNHYQLYNKSPRGFYPNIITQNLVARSTSITNKEKIELASLNNSWTAALVSIIPYILNTLKAYKLSMTPDVQYRDMSVVQMISQIIDIVTAFYDEISNFAPFMPFMASNIQINQTKPKPHLFAELLGLISNSTVVDLDINDYMKMEWANQYFFRGIDNIKFPEYKTRDRFEWIKGFAKSKIDSGTFATEFETSVQILGKLGWSALIAKSAAHIRDLKNDTKEIDQLIIDIIHRMSDCDTEIIQKYINGVLETYTEMFNKRPANMLRGGHNVTFNHVNISDEKLKLIRNITRYVVNPEKIVIESEPTKRERFIMKNKGMKEIIETNEVSQFSAALTELTEAQRFIISDARISNEHKRKFARLDAERRKQYAEKISAMCNDTLNIINILKSNCRCFDVDFMDQSAALFNKYLIELCIDDNFQLYDNKGKDDFTKIALRGLLLVCLGNRKSKLPDDENGHRQILSAVRTVITSKRTIHGINETPEEIFEKVCNYVWEHHAYYDSHNGVLCNDGDGSSEYLINPANLSDKERNKLAAALLACQSDANGNNNGSTGAFMTKFGAHMDVGIQDANGGDRAQWEATVKIIDPGHASFSAFIAHVKSGVNTGDKPDECMNTENMLKSYLKTFRLSFLTDISNIVLHTSTARSDSIKELYDAACKIPKMRTVDIYSYVLREFNLNISKKDENFAKMYHMIYKRVSDAVEADGNDQAYADNNNVAPGSLVFKEAVTPDVSRIIYSINENAAKLITSVDGSVVASLMLDEFYALSNNPMTRKYLRECVFDAMMNAPDTVLNTRNDIANHIRNAVNAAFNNGKYRHLTGAGDIVTASDANNANNVANNVVAGNGGNLTDEQNNVKAKIDGVLSFIHIYVYKMTTEQRSKLDALNLDPASVINANPDVICHFQMIYGIIMHTNQREDWAVGNIYGDGDHAARPGPIAAYIMAAELAKHIKYDGGTTKENQISCKYPRPFYRLLFHACHVANHSNAPHDAAYNDNQFATILREILWPLLGTEDDYKGYITDDHLDDDDQNHPKRIVERLPTMEHVEKFTRLLSMISKIKINGNNTLAQPGAICDPNDQNAALVAYHMAHSWAYRALSTRSAQSLMWDNNQQQAPANQLTVMDNASILAFKIVKIWAANNAAYNDANGINNVDALDNPVTSIGQIQNAGHPIPIQSADMTHANLDAGAHNEEKRTIFAILNVLSKFVWSYVDDTLKETKDKLIDISNVISLKAVGNAISVALTYSTATGLNDNNRFNNANIEAVANAGNVNAICDGTFVKQSLFFVLFMMIKRAGNGKNFIGYQTTNFIDAANANAAADDTANANFNTGDIDQLRAEFNQCDSAGDIETVFKSDTTNPINSAHGNAIITQNQLNTAPKDQPVYSLYNELHLTSLPVNNFHGGSMKIQGGAALFTEDIKTSILAVAASYNARVENRTKYFDRSQTFDSIPFIARFEVDKPNIYRNDLRYKLLFNPTLCGGNELDAYTKLLLELKDAPHDVVWPINSETPAQANYITNIIRDNLARNTKGWSYDGLSFDARCFNVPGGNVPDQNDAVPDPAVDDRDQVVKGIWHINQYRTTNRIVGAPVIPNYGTAVDLGKHGWSMYWWDSKNGVRASLLDNQDRTQRNGIAIVVDPQHPSSSNVIAIFQSQSNNNNPANDTKPLANNDIDLANNVVAISDIRARVRDIKVSDEMFKLAYTNQFINLYLSSPQKDIFNATVSKHLEAGPAPAPTYAIKESVPCCLIDLDTDYKNNWGINCLTHLDGNYIWSGHNVALDSYTNAANITDYNSPTIKSIYAFIDSLVDKNIKLTFSPIDGEYHATDFNTYGFNLGSKSKDSDYGSHFAGGASLREFASAFVKTENQINGNTEFELLAAAYGGRNNAPACELYNALFNYDIGGPINKSSDMFRLILNYFHKYNVSFASMFNQLCFPSILFNSSCFRSFMKVLRKQAQFVLSDSTITTNGNNSSFDSKQMFINLKFITSSCNDENEFTLDRYKSFTNQINIRGTPRTENISIQDVAAKFNSPGALYNDQTSCIISNQYVTPSVGNNYLCELLKYVNTQDETDKDAKGYQLNNLSTLFASGVMEAIRHLDGISTYTSNVFSLLKHTSRYSLEENKDISYFNVDSSEPFGVV